MANTSSLAMKLGGLTAATYVQTWMGTLDLQAVVYDATVDPTQATYGGPYVCAFWHEYLLVPFFLYGHTNTAILTSRHRDAHWIAEAARHLGYDTIRGSTFRGGSQAILEFLRHNGERSIGIACDGPRGPRRQLAQGAIYLASRLQMPLVLCGVGYDRPWRTPTWDQFAVPRPGSRARLIVGPPMLIPAGLGRQNVEHYRQRSEQLLLRLTLEAEAWATSGTRKIGQFAARRRPGHPSYRSKRHVPTPSTTSNAAAKTPRPMGSRQAA